MTDESARVLASPTVRCSAMSRSSRRMILPDRVFGSSWTTRIRFGLAIDPISLATCARSASTVPSSSTNPPRRMTNATTTCPVVSSDAPTTAASATDGC